MALGLPEVFSQPNLVPHIQSPLLILRFLWSFILAVPRNRYQKLTPSFKLVVSQKMVGKIGKMVKLKMVKLKLNGKMVIIKW